RQHQAPEFAARRRPRQAGLGHGPQGQGLERLIPASLFCVDERQSSEALLVEVLDGDLARLAVRADQETYAQARGGCLREGGVHEQVSIEMGHREALARWPEMKEERSARVRNLRIAN